MNRMGMSFDKNRYSLVGIKKSPCYNAKEAAREFEVSYSLLRKKIKETGLEPKFAVRRSNGRTDVLYYEKRKILTLINQIKNKQEGLWLAE